jgi:Flp pilus assembly protein TadG
MSLVRHRGTDRDAGASAVEFALVAMFALMPLLLGIIQFGFIFYSQITITHAAREGVRPLAVVIPCDSSCVAAAKTRTIDAAGPAVTLTNANFVTVQTCAVGSTQTTDARLVVHYDVTAAWLFHITLMGKASLPCGG